MYTNLTTRAVKVKNLTLGGNNHIYIQSMTNTKTKDINATVKQILELEKAGCEIIRVAILDMEDALCISKIQEQINIPLVADIHFDPKLAIESINQGVDAIRLNPGNIHDKEKIKTIVDLCKLKQIPIRIGVNSGSLPKGLPLTAESFIKAAKMHVDILEELDFFDIVISIKASNVLLTIKCYELAAKTFPYPLHVGVTEAGTTFNGIIKSAMGIAPLLLKGIGNTIRVSLTDDPIYEIKAAKEILKNLGFLNDLPILTSCPTCGRTEYDMIKIAKEIEMYLDNVHKKIHVAIMGCPVNGPGEAKEADIGIAGSNNEAFLFKKGKVVKKLQENEILEVLKNEIDSF